MHFRSRMKQWIHIAFALSFAAGASGLNPLALARAQEQVDLRQYDMLTASSGWVLLGGHLFSTSDAGQTWNEIGPALSSDASIQDIQFIDAHTGWMLWTMIDPNSGASFYLVQTLDGGNTWTTRPLSLFEPGEVGSYVEKAEMGWFDAQTGWISVKQTRGPTLALAYCSPPQTVEPAGAAPFFRSPTESFSAIQQQDGRPADPQMTRYSRHRMLAGPGMMCNLPTSPVPEPSPIRHLFQADKVCWW